MSASTHEGATLRPIGKAATLALDSLVPGESNRQTVRDEDLKGLATSIKTVGLIYPLVVRPDADQDGIYRIIAGERRWRAMKSLKIESAPCLVLSARDDEANAEILRVVENHQRRNLALLEEAAAVRNRLDLGLEPQAVARSLGRSRAWVARRASLTELSEAWLIQVRNPDTKISTWPPSHLEVISRFPADVQDRMLEEWGGQWHWQVPTFRDLVELTGQFLHVLSAAPWKLDDDALCPEAGACNVCPKRSSHMPDLFAGELDAGEGKTPPGDRCLDFQCWNRKAEQFLTRKAEELRKEHPNLVLLNNGEQNGVDFEETFQTEVLNAHDVASGRKSDENTLPALVVNGPGLGRVKWVQPVHDEMPTAPRGRRQATSETESPVDSSLRD
jgi:ParB/RepB/Spo0J family partition protein